MENYTATGTAQSVPEQGFRLGGSGYASKLTWPDSLLSNLAIAAILGFLYALYLVGPRVLNPCDISWLNGDTATHYQAWAFLRQDSHLHWPLTYTNRIGYPMGDSISFMDPNPLLLLLFRPFSSLLPWPFQLLGIEIVLVCILQLFFALRLFRRVVGPAFWGVLLPSIFFLISPAMALRFGLGHGALSNHWLLTAGLLLYVRTYRKPAISTRQFIALALVLAAVATAINPYLAFQVELLLVIAVSGLLWTRRLSLVWVLGSAAAIGAVSLFSAYLFGFIIPSGGGYGAGGYRMYSLNLLSPLDPNRYGSLLLPRLPSFVDQYEGYNYLGAGVLLLSLAIGVFAVLKRSKLRNLGWHAAVPLLLWCLILTILAFSTMITLGSRVLVDLDPHGKFTTYFSALRCSGRLFWGPYYTILLGVCAMPYRLMSQRSANLLIAAALIVQVVDLIPFQKTMHAAADQTPGTPLKSPVWHKLGASYSNLIVMPPWQCGYPNSPGGLDGFQTFGLLAVEQHMRTNSYYTGRLTERNREFHCEQSITALKAHPLASDSAYVVSPTVAAELISRGLGKCHTLDGFVLCSANGDFGLGNQPWTSPTELWVKQEIQTILMRPATRAEIADWDEKLDRHVKSQADFIATLLNSAEFQQHTLPRIETFVHQNGRWPSFQEWTDLSSNGAQTNRAAAQAGIDPRDRRLAVTYMLYFGLLRRDPDPGGLATWSASLTQNSDATVASEFLKSAEYESNGYLVAR